jgi:hypothetical protein
VNCYSHYLTLPEWFWKVSKREHAHNPLCYTIVLWSLWYTLLKFYTILRSLYIKLTFVFTTIVCLTHFDCLYIYLSTFAWTFFKTHHNLVFSFQRETPQFSRKIINEVTKYSASSRVFHPYVKHQFISIQVEMIF